MGISEIIPDGEDVAYISFLGTETVYVKLDCEKEEVTVSTEKGATLATTSASK